MQNIHPDRALWLVAEQSNERIAINEQRRRIAEAGLTSRSSVRHIAGGALLRLGARLSEPS